MDAVAAQPAARGGAGENEPQPLPRPSDGRGSLHEVKAAQAELLARIAEAETKCLVALAAKLDAFQRLALGVKQGQPGAGGCLVNLEDDLIQARLGGGHRGQGHIGGVFGREFYATVAPPLQPYSFHGRAFPGQVGRTPAIEHEPMGRRDFLWGRSTAKDGYVLQRGVVGHFHVEALGGALHGDRHHRRVPPGQDDGSVLTADLVGAGQQPHAAMVVGRHQGPEAQPQVLFRHGLAGLLLDAVGRAARGTKSETPCPSPQT